MPSAITVYCAGTAYDSKNEDVVAWLNSNTAGTRNKDLLFFPGPGSGEYAASLTSASIAESARAVAKSAFGKIPQVQIAADTVAVSSSGVNSVQKVADQALGSSLRERIRSGVTQLRDAGAAGGTINLVGWSRGAVTCLGIAYALADDSELRTCKVNLFLFDPVPGPEKLGLNGNNWAKELTSLRENVNALAVVLMENDDRDWMMPPLTAPFTSCSKEKCGAVDKSRISLYPMPGAHSSAVEYGGHYFESADIGAHLVSAFLLQHGTNVSRAKLQPDVSLIDMYARLKRKAFYGFVGREANYALQADGGFGVRVAEVPVARLAKIPNEARGTRFFVNEHHRTLMQQQFPALAWILDPTLPPSRNSSGGDLGIARLRASAPNMAQLVGDGVAAMLTVPNVCLRDEADLRKLLSTMGYAGEVRATFAPTKTSATGTFFVPRGPR